MGGMNPIAIDVGGGVSGAPHAKTLRSTYIVPHRKGAVISSFIMEISIVSNVTIPSVATISYELVRGGNLPIEIGKTSVVLLAANPMSQITHTPNIPLMPGDIINIFTSDVSTGGVKHFHTDASVVEFDF